MSVKFRRLSDGMRIALAVAALLLASFAAAQELRGDHPATYVVKRGDTLWDIAGRFLKRPWLWPEIWQANPQVRNPHLIYPGDVLSLAYSNRMAMTMQPGPRQDAPIDAIPLSAVEPYLKDLRVVDQFDQLPYVVGQEDDRLRSTGDQVVYVKNLPSARVGERYMVVRPTVRYTRLDRVACCDIFYKDDLDYRGRRTIDFQNYWTNAVVGDHGHELLGFELMRVATGTLTRGQVGGIQASTLLLDREASMEVRDGDRVVPVAPQTYDLQFFPHPPKRQLDYGRARVVAVSGQLDTGGPHDVVALSVGAREGVDNGTVFSVWRVGQSTVDPVRRDQSELDEDRDSPRNHVRLPDEFAGHVMVFRTFDKVSYGLVMDSIKPTQIGDELKHPDAPY